MIRIFFLAALVVLIPVFAWLHSTDYRPVVERALAQLVSETCLTREKALSPS